MEAQKNKEITELRQKAAADWIEQTNGIDQTVRAMYAELPQYADEWLAYELDVLEYEYQEKKRLIGESKLLDDWYWSARKKLAEKIREKTGQVTVEQINAYRDMYKDMRGYEASYYEASARLIDLQAQKYRSAQVDEATIAAWATREKKKLWLEYAKNSESVIDGIRAAAIEMYDDAMTRGRAAYEMVKSLAANSQRVLGDVFFDAVKRDLKSFQDYWRAWTDALLRTFVDIVARMVVEWTTAQIAMSRIGVSMGLSSSAMAGAAGAGYAAGGMGSMVPMAGAAYGGYSLAGAGSGYSLAALTSGTGYAAGTLSGDAVVASLAAENAYMGSLYAQSGWLSTVSAAAPYVLAALLADQILFGGRGTNAVVDGVSSVVSGAVDAVSSVVSSIGSVFGFADGAAFDRGRVIPFAAGDVLDRPTFFPMADGYTGLAGEDGPEAIMPLKRGSDGKLGVVAQGAGGATIEINSPLIHIGGNLIADKGTFDEFTEELYNRMVKLTRMGHGGK